MDRFLWALGAIGLSVFLYALVAVLRGERDEEIPGEENVIRFAPGMKGGATLREGRTR